MLVGALVDSDDSLDHDSAERQSLLGRAAKDTGNKAGRVKQRTIKLALMGTLTAALVVFVVFLVIYSRSAEESDSQNPIELAVVGKPLHNKAGSAQLSLKISNEYGTNQQQSMMPYPFLKGSYLIEPYRETTIHIVGLDAQRNCPISWTLKGKNAEYQGLVDTNQLFTVTLQYTGLYLLSLSYGCDPTVPIATFQVWVKYVRRELLTLTDRDREDFLDAFHTLWRVSTIEGQKIYGEKYKSLYYFAMIHNDAAGNGVCDEFHGGLGFVNNHVYLSSFLEQSLQLVNPRVALHYMDYSKYFESDAFTEGHLSDTMDGGRWTEILTSKWFGTNDPITGRIVDGRWVNSPVPMVNDEFFRTQGINKTQVFFPAEADRWLPYQSAHMHSPNGLLRARWSLNPVDYTIRFNNVDRFVDAHSLGTRAYDKYRGVTCENYVEFIRLYALHQPFEILLNNMEGNVHGPIHFTFGGAGGDKYFENDQILRERFGFTDSDLAFITQLSHTYMKLEAPRWWTGGKDTRISWNCTFPVPLTTAIDALQSMQAQKGELNWPGEPGGTYCDANAYYYQSDTTLNEFIDLFFLPLSVSSVSTADKFRNLPFADKAEAVRLLNTRYQFDGDMATSSAAIDPLFWVQHGAVERLFQRIIFEDILLDKSFTTLDKCSGHSADETKFWLTGFTFEDPSVKPESLTNVELTEILDPTSDKYRDYVNFVYDTASFGFCAEVEELFASA